MSPASSAALRSCITPKMGAKAKSVRLVGGSRSPQTTPDPYPTVAIVFDSLLAAIATGGTGLGQAGSQARGAAALSALAGPGPELRRF